MKGELTNAGLRVAGPPLFNCALTHAVLGLAAPAPHLDSATTFLTADGPAAPTSPALCRRREEERF